MRSKRTKILAWNPITQGHRGSKRGCNLFSLEKTKPKGKPRGRNEKRRTILREKNIKKKGGLAETSKGKQERGKPIKSSQFAGGWWGVEVHEFDHNPENPTEGKKTHKLEPHES